MAIDLDQARGIEHDARTAAHRAQMEHEEQMTDKLSPIEVWLRQINMQVTCMVVHEDETTENLDVDSLSMRGAQREMTGWFLRNGYVAVGRWENEYFDKDDVGDIAPVETVRRFKPAPEKAA